MTRRPGGIVFKSVDKCMEFSAYYVYRNLEDMLDEVGSEAGLVSESASQTFEVKSFVADNRKGPAMEKHVKYFSLKYPTVRSCDVEDSLSEALAKLSKDNPRDAKSAIKTLRKYVDGILSEVKKKGKDVKKNVSCLKSIKSFSSKGVDLNSVIGKARGLLTSNEKIALELCSSGHSVREMGSIMKISFPTAWRTLNKALDKVRISHGMRSRHRDKR